MSVAPDGTLPIELPPADAERAKWERHYAATAIEDESPEMARFGAEFAAAVSELLPAGGRVLEAGAGAGWHSLALARTGRFAVTLLDFAGEALRHARAQFARAGLNAEFMLGDAREHGPRDYDLVFNSGVLEHLSPPEQAELLRAMASRSRSLVLALVPNRRCYWYWVWRVQAGARGEWPFGREVPPGGLGDAFAAAGIEVLGERVLGADWTDSFLDYLAGLEPDLRECLLAVHRSGLVPAETRGYLLAVLGRVAGSSDAAGAGWERAQGAHAGDALGAALADALALQVRMSAELARSQAGHQRLEAEARSQGEVQRARLAELEGERARLAEALAVERARHEAGAHALREAVAAAQVRASDLQRQWADSVARGERLAMDLERAHAELRGSAAERDRLQAVHDDLARAHRALQDWQAVVERSLTFRLLRRLEGWRARLRL